MKQWQGCNECLPRSQLGFDASLHMLTALLQGARIT